MTQLHVEVTPDFRYQVVTTEDGIVTKPVGSPWKTPAEASAHIRSLTDSTTRAGHTPAGDSDSSATAADALLGSSGPVIDVTVDLPPSRSDDPLSLGLL